MLVRVSNSTTRGSKLLSFTRFPARTHPRLLQSPPTHNSLYLSRSTASLACKMTPTPWTPNQYPPARRSDHVDVYKSKQQGQVRVADPYQWLEEHSDETNAWTSAQDDFTRTYLHKNPDRAKLEKEIMANTDYEKVRSSWTCAHDRAVDDDTVHRSLPRLSPTITNGIGIITAAFRHSRVCRFDGREYITLTSIPLSALPVNQRKGPRLLLQGRGIQGRSVL